MIHTVALLLVSTDETSSETKIIYLVFLREWWFCQLFLGANRWLWFPSTTPTRRWNRCRPSPRSRLKPKPADKFFFQICWMVTLFTKLVKSYFKYIKCNIQRTHTHTRNWRSRIRCSFLSITNTSKDNPYISHYARCPVRE